MPSGSASGSSSDGGSKSKKTKSPIRSSEKSSAICGRLDFQETAWPFDILHSYCQHVWDALLICAEGSCEPYGIHLAGERLRQGSDPYKMTYFASRILSRK